MFLSFSLKEIVQSLREKEQKRKTHENVAGHFRNIIRKKINIVIKQNHSDQKQIK